MLLCAAIVRAVVCLFVSAQICAYINMHDVYMSASVCVCEHQCPTVASSLLDIATHRQLVLWCSKWQHLGSNVWWRPTWQNRGPLYWFCRQANSGAISFIQVNADKYIYIYLTWYHTHASMLLLLSQIHASYIP